MVRKVQSIRKELDLVIMDDEKEFAYLFECKFKQKDFISPESTFMSGYLEDNDLKNVEIWEKNTDSITIGI